jgi:hypothetical protein
MLVRLYCLTLNKVVIPCNFTVSTLSLHLRDDAEAPVIDGVDGTQVRFSI